MIDSANLVEDNESCADQTESPSPSKGRRRSNSSRGTRRRRDRRNAVAVALAAALLAITGLGAWFEVRTRQDQLVEQQRNLFLQVAREAALDLTTIDYTRVQADIQRVLDTSTGAFYDDFHTRSAALAEFVTKSQSKTRGTVTESGIESTNGDTARILVAMSVNVSNAGAAEQEPRNWRMRIDVQRTGDTVKVSNVGFVV